MISSYSKYWNLLGGMIVLIIILIFIIPLINDHIISDSSRIIKQRNIDAGSLIYSDSNEALEANFLLLKTKKNN